MDKDKDTGTGKVCNRCHREVGPFSSADSVLRVTPVIL